MKARRRAPRAGPPWWIRPSLFLTLVLLPIIGTATSLGGPMMAQFGSLNFLDSFYTGLVITQVAFLAAGSAIGEHVAQPVIDRRVYSPARFEKAMNVMLIASIVSHVILLGQILANPALVMNVLTGQLGAIYDAKGEMNKVSGVTSFTQLYLIAVPMLALFPTIFDRPPSRKTNVLMLVLGVLVLARALLTAERFALIEGVVAFALPYFAFRVKYAKIAASMPAIGLVLTIMLFAVGEYTRSWPYYEAQYSSFGAFVYERLIGYLATAVNNGSGVIETTSPVYAPFATAAWFHKLPLWDVVDNPFLIENPIRVYLNNLGNPEYNNPGGLLSPIIDYGVIGGSVCNIIIGFSCGVLFKNFMALKPVSILLYPTFYLGLVIVNQGFYWGDPRVFMVYLTVPFVVMYIRKRKRAGRGVR